MHDIRAVSLLPQRILALLLALFAIASAGPRALAAIINVPAGSKIQFGIDAAAPGDTVLVAPGTYLENIDFKGKAITVISSDGPITTTIDGRDSGPAVQFQSAETRASILSGFTLTNNPIPGNPLHNAPGVQIIANPQTLAASSPTVLNNIITDNQCYGVIVSNSGALIQSNIIRKTHYLPGQCSIASGAGVFIITDPQHASQVHVEPAILGNTIELNTESGLDGLPGNGGAGIAVWGGLPIIENNIIRNNATGKVAAPGAGGEGGGVFFYLGGGLLIQNLIYGNSSSSDGGGVAAQHGGFAIGPPKVAILNNTFVDNRVLPLATSSLPVLGGQQLLIYEATAVANNIFSGNTPQPSVVCYHAGSQDFRSTTSFDNNIFFNSGGPGVDPSCLNAAGVNGNLSTDPQLLNPAQGDFHLRAGSPAIDAGNNSALQLAYSLGADSSATSPVRFDFDNTPPNTTPTPPNPRVQNNIIDIGAYETAGVSTPNATTILLTPNSYQVTGGNSVTLTAQLLAGALGSPTGAVTFILDGKPGSSVNLDGTGSATLTVPSLTPGLHSYQATYSGQGAFTPASSLHIYVVADPYLTTLKIVPDFNPSVLNQAVTFTATITSADSTFPGPIQLTDGTTPLGGPLTPDSTGKVTYTTSTLTLGTHTITASYAGDATHASSSGTVTQQVNSGGLATTTMLACTPATAAPGSPINLTATVTSANGVPTGSLTFAEGANSFATQPLVAGSTAYTLSTLAPGLHTLTATYAPTGAFGPSSGTCAVTISGQSTTVALAASPNPSLVLQPVTLTAHVPSTTGTPATGTVTFQSGTLTTTANLNASGDAVASLTFPPAGPGPSTYVITASYQGDRNNAPSTSGPVQHLVQLNPTAIALAVNPNPAGQSQTVSLAVTVTTPSAFAPIAGDVTIFDGTAVLAIQPVTSSGRLVFNTAFSAASTHTFTAVFATNSVFSGSTSTPVTLLVNSTDFTVSATPTITIQAQHHASTPVTLTSLGSFTGLVSLSCSNLPTWTSCAFDPIKNQLPANGTVTASLYLDTDGVIGYARNTPAPNPTGPNPAGASQAGTTLAALRTPGPAGTNPGSSSRFSSAASLFSNASGLFSSAAGLAFLLPAGLLFGAGLGFRRPRRLPIRLLAFALAALATTLTLSGCSGRYPPYTTPGTYTITITGTAAGGIVHSTNVILIVTP